MIRLTLLGGVALFGADGQSLQPVLSQPKRLAVLAYLALAGSGKFRSRDTMLALFWPDATQARARRSLNQTLHFLRQALGSGAISSRGPGELGISTDAFWCDSVAFDEMIKAGDLAGALHIYGGELLPGFFTDAAPEFDQWLSSERMRLQRAASVAAWKLAEAAETDHELSTASKWGRAAVELSLNDETSVRTLIELLRRIGDRAGALQAYDSFARRLATEYATEPAAVTKRLVAQIRMAADAPSGSPGVSIERHVAALGPDAVASDGMSKLETTTEHDGVLAEGVVPSEAPVIPTRRTRAVVSKVRRYWVLVAVIALVLGAGGTYFRDTLLAARHASTSHFQASIIVREFGGMGARTDSVQLERALTSAVVNQLAQVRAFNVVAAPAVGAAQTTPKGGATSLGVLVTGNVVQSGGQIRVNVQIADAESGRTIKSAVLDHPAGALLPLVDSLSVQISSLVRTAVGHEIRLREWSVGTGNERVYALMQDVDEHRDRAGQLTASGDLAAAARALQSADTVLIQVERASPGWSEPMIERAEVFQSLGAMFMIPPIRDLAKVRELLGRGISEASRAVSLKPGDASALEALGSVEYWYWLAVPLPADSAQHVLTRAETTLRAAVTADPSRASAWSLLSASLYGRADYAGAYLTADRAYRADAYLRSSETILDALFLASYEMDDIPTATRWCDEINRRIGQGWLSSYCRLRLLSSNDTKDAHATATAWRIAQEAADRASGTAAIPPELQMLVAVVIARQGLRDSAEAVIRTARERGGGNADLLPAEADVRIQLGQPDSATALMTRYIMAQPSRRAGVARSRTFAGLVQFQQLLNRMNIPQSARK